MILFKPVLLKLLIFYLYDISLEIRNCRVFNDFKRNAKAHYFDVANERLSRE